MIWHCTRMRDYLVARAGNMPCERLVGGPVSEETPTPAPEEKPATPKKKLLQKTGAQVGDTVLYQQHDGEPHAATVCKVWSADVVNLDVTDGNGHHYVVTSATRGTGAGTFRDRSNS